MKKILAAQLLGLVCAGTPLAALAAEMSEADVLHLLGIVAALTAQRDHTSLACAMAAIPSSVQAGESFSLVWNTVGAVSPEDKPAKSVFAPGGSTSIIITTPGAYKYEMEFYSASGARVTCSTLVFVR